MLFIHIGEFVKRETGKGVDEHFEEIGISFPSEDHNDSFWWTACMNTDF